MFTGLRTDHDPWQEEDSEPGTYEPERPDSMEVCAEVYWPARHLWQDHQWRPERKGPVSWTGSLILNKRDLTGQLYMRNRYYDSETGRFTQEDPIGLAGGINLYGFAAGDPVNFSDPFGLCRPICAERFAAWHYGRNSLNRPQPSPQAARAAGWQQLKPEQAV